MAKDMLTIRAGSTATTKASQAGSPAKSSLPKCAACSPARKRRIVPTVRHADYIGAWPEVLWEDARAIFRTAAQASKAADYLLGFRTDGAGKAGQGMTE